MFRTEAVEDTRMVTGCKLGFEAFQYPETLFAICAPSCLDTGQSGFAAGASAMNQAIFLDRDGTIIEDRNYLRRPEEVVVLPGAISALKQLQNAGFKLFIVTNQSGIG